MSGAARKAKLTKYEVTVRRTIEQLAVVEVDARNVEEAQQIVETAVDEAGLPKWSEGAVLSLSAKAKVLRVHREPLPKAHVIKL